MEFFTDTQVDIALQQYASRKQYKRKYNQEQKEKKERLEKERTDRLCQEMDATLASENNHKKTYIPISKDNASELPAWKDIQDFVRRTG